MREKEVNISTTAVWDMLSESITGVTVDELCHQLKMTFSEVINAVRWLARDHNIGLQMQGQRLIVIGAD